MAQTHDRTSAHSGVEDTNTVILASTIGRYALGSNLTDVLVDMVRRLIWIEANCGTSFIFPIAANAVIWGATSFTADAYVHQGGTGVLTANGTIKKAIPKSFAANAFILEVVC